MHASECLVIFLHGVGSHGADMAPIGEALKSALPRALFAAPDAPNRFDGGGSGFQWFSISGITPQTRTARIADARAGFDRVVQAEIDRHGFGGRLDRVALFGFSQGAILAIDAIADGRWPVGAIVGASGRLADPTDKQAVVKTQVLLLHGALDQVVAVYELPFAERELRRAGFPVEAHMYPDVGHSVSRQGIEAAAVFLARTVGR